MGAPLLGHVWERVVKWKQAQISSARAHVLFVGCLPYLSFRCFLPFFCPRARGAPLSFGRPIVWATGSRGLVCRSEHLSQIFITR